MINPVGWSVYQNQSHISPKVQLATEAEKYNPKLQKFIQQGDQQATLIGKFDDKTLKELHIIPCQTCASRVYQDGSNDPGVSFKSPTHIAPEQSASMVAAHEQEHVTREAAQAESEGREVISQSVRLYNGVCVECGKTYVAGGVTETTTATRQNPKVNNELYKGSLVDLRL